MCAAAAGRLRGCEKRGGFDHVGAGAVYGIFDGLDFGGALERFLGVLDFSCYRGFQAFQAWNAGSKRFKRETLGTPRAGGTKLIIIHYYRSEEGEI
jgi:hypothetical protein